MRQLFKNVRFYVIVFSLILSIGVYAYITQIVPSGSLQIIKLTQTFALISITYLYLALLAGPLCFTFRFLPLRGAYLKARRSLGVSAFYFGLLHASFAFFGQLGGFAGLGFLTPKYLLAISLSFISLVILFLMTSTSFDFMVAKLTYPKWKLLHRSVYLVGILVMIHALMLGTHFADLSATIPHVLFWAVIFLSILEGLRVDAFLRKSIPWPTVFSPMPLMFVGGLMWFYGTYMQTSAGAIGLGIHAQHIQLAKEAQQKTSTSEKNPGLQGDKTKRYTVSFNHPENPLPKQDIPLSFQIFDAANGSKIHLFSKIYEKTMHLIIVSSDLSYYEHIHPEQTEKEFNITAKFPKSDIYHLYLDFQPLGAIEQQFGFTLNVGNVDKASILTTEQDKALTKIFSGYEVTFSFPKPLKASELSVGNQKLTFTIRDAITKQPITTLKPYLASFGHLVMINTQTFDYLHVHPTTMLPKTPNPTGGPDVEFMPLGLYGPIKPGIYRVFAQFNPDGKLILADFTVKVE